MAFNAGDIEARLILDRSQFNREMDAAEKRAQAFERKKWKATIGLDLDDGQARRDLERFKREMAGIRNRDVTLKARLDTRGLRRDLNQTFREINRSRDLKIVPQIDRDAIRRQMSGVNRDMRSTIKLDVDQGRIENLSGSADYQVHFNRGAAEAEATALAHSLARDVIFTVKLNERDISNQVTGAVRGLSGGRDGDNTVRIRVDADTTRAIENMGNLAQVTESVVEGAAEVGESAAEGLGTFQMYAGLAAAALPPIAAGIAGLPGLILNASVPMVTLALGIDGIAQSVQVLRPQFQGLKNEVNSVFVEGLAPAMANINRLMPGLERGFHGSAEALGFMARDITAVASSSRQLENMDKIFASTNATVRQLTPSMSGLVDNFFQLGVASTQGLEPVPAMLLQVSNAWTDVISTITNNQSAQQAITALMQAVVQLLGVIAPLTQLGVELFAAFGPALGVAIAAVSGALQILANIFSALPGPIQSVVAAMAAYRLASMFLGRGAKADAAQVALMSTAMRQAMGTAAPLATGVTRVGSAAAAAAPRAGLLARAGGALAGVFGGPMGLAVTGAIIGLSAFGGALQEAQQRTLDHQMAIKQYADALRSTGGVVTQFVVDITAQRASALGLDASLVKLGVTSKDLTLALASGAPEVEKLGASMLEGANKADAFQVSTDFMGKSMQEAGGATGFLGKAIEILGGTIGSVFGTGAADAVKSLTLMQKEFQLGAEASTRLSAAQQELQAHLLATGGTIDRSALSTAAWAATFEALIDPTKSVVEVTELAAGAFGMASIEARNMAAANVTSVSSMKDFEKTLKDINPAIIDASGNIDLWAKGGLELQSSALQAAQGVDQLFAATLAQTGSMGEAAGKAAVMRQRFVEMGVAAGVPREKMQALVDTLIAWPPEVTTAINTPGFTEATAKAVGLADQIVKIPNDKSVVVKSITAQAEAALTSLGLQVVHLPNGQILITADPNPLLDTLPVVGDFIKNLPPAEMPVGADTAPAEAGVGTLEGAIQGKAPKMGVGAEDRGATEQGGLIAGTISFLMGVLGIGGEDRGATGTATGIAGTITGMTGTEGVNAEDRGATGVAGGIKGTIDGMVGTEGVNAADRGANAAATGIKGFIDGLLGVEGINAEDRGAKSVADGIVGYISGLVATITITAKKVGDFFGFGGAEGGIIQPMADGGITAYAQGGMGSRQRMNAGMRRTRPMSAGSAEIVNPGTWRLIGDRSVGAEAFIPLVRTARSRGILMQAAAALGYGVYDLADMRDQLTAGESPVATPFVSGRAMRVSGGDGADMDKLSKKLDEVIQAVREGGGINIGSVNTIDTAKKLADEINFRVRHARRPGVHR